MSAKKENFRLNDEARRRIDEEFGAIPDKRVKRVKAKAKSESVKVPTPDFSYGGGYPEYGEDLVPHANECPEKPKKHRIRKLIIAVAILCVAVILLDIVFLFYRGQIWFNEPRKRDYPVRGAVVTQELGKVDWQIMSQQTISFAYVRATKGTTFIDKEFENNRKNSRGKGLLIGYWHEFDFRTDGEKQAEHFISECGSMDNLLRPMVKVTKYGIYNLHMKDEETVKENLQAFLDRVEEEYGRKPVIMCDSACYKKYIEPYFDDYTLWMIGHFSEPDEEETGWAMWEYNPRVRTTGYENSKKYFAMSVYRQDKDLDNFKKNMLMSK